MPGMLQAMAWVLLASPRIGFFNVALMNVFGLSKPLLNIYTLPGMIFIEGLRAVPTAFLMLVPLLRSMDPSLEEAAATSGARPWSSMRKVTLGLMLPGLLAVTIYQFTSVLEGFEVPGILGLPTGIYVFSTKIYTVLHSASSLPAYGEANALAMLYVVIAVVSTYFYSRVIGKSERYTIITGKGYRPKVARLGFWRWPAFGLVLVFLSLSVIIPFLVFAYVSFLPFLQAPSAKAFASMSWANYDTIMHTEQLGHMLWNTVLMTVCVALGVVALSFVISLVVVRSRFWGRKILDQFAFIPHSIPGMVMGLALLWIYLQIDKTGVGLFGSIWSIIIAFIIGYMSYGTRVMNAALLQVHKDLEDAAKMSGARQWRVMLRVFCPLLLPSMVGIAVWTALHVVRSAGKPLILADGSENEVLAVVIWNMWDQGYVEAVGAIGTILILVMAAFTLLLRVVGFGRGAHIQGAGGQ
jgi:iron(III) transport system permease protein